MRRVCQKVLFIVEAVIRYKVFRFSLGLFLNLHFYHRSWRTYLGRSFSSFALLHIVFFGDILLT
jgi:hypothetical protein